MSTIDIQSPLARHLYTRRRRYDLFPCKIV